jgi:hypothetical protein
MAAAAAASSSSVEFSRPHAREALKGESTFYGGNGAHQRRRLAGVMNAKAVAAKMDLLEAVQSMTKFVPAMLSIVVTDYAAELRPPRDELEALLMPFTEPKAVWGWQRPAGSMADDTPVVMQMRKAFSDVTWFSWDNVRFCQLYEDTNYAATVFHVSPDDADVKVLCFMPDGMAVEVGPATPGDIQELEQHVQAGRVAAFEELPVGAKRRRLG